jgi:hypothetical protein
MYSEIKLYILTQRRKVAKNRVKLYTHVC